MIKLSQDLRYAVRTLAARPGFTAVAVLTLALGIGANTTIFTVFDRALLKPLPVEAPDELVRISTLRERGRQNMNFSYPALRAYQESSEALSGVLGFSPRPFTMTTPGSAERIEGAAVSANFFDVLGVGPARGRAFASGEDRAVAVLSHAFWRRRFGGDPSIVGRTLTLNGAPVAVVGVAREGFRGLQRGASRDVWVPFGAMPALGLPDAFMTEPNIRWIYMVGRRAPGVTPEQAQQAMSMTFERREAERPSGELGIRLEPGARGFAWMLDRYGQPLTVLMGVVGLVLLIACANVANLLLARARARRREIAVRLSLGASRARLVRQLLTESAVLTGLGAGAGILLAGWAADLLAGFRPVTGDAMSFGTAPDARVLAFTLGVAAFAVFAAGLAPAWRATRPELVPALKAGGAVRPGGSRRRMTLQGALVAGQIALALVILVGAGLLTSSLRNLTAVDVGYAARDVLLASIDVGDAGYDDDRGRTLYNTLVERLEALPGVRSAAVATTVTPSPAGSNFNGLRLEGYDAAPDEDIAFDVNRIGPGYFETLDMPILRGRGFEAGDGRDAQRVAVIDETIARRYWPDTDPIGKRIFFGDGPDAPALRVVGVAKAGRYRGVRETDGMMLYAPIQQIYDDRATLLVRAAGDPASLTAAVRSVVREIDASLPLYDVDTIRSHIGRVLATDRMVALLTLAFGLLALTLAALGVYGVMAHAAVRRMREVGIRMALGARRLDVLRLMLARSGPMLAVGIAVGVVAAVASGRLLAGLLYGVTPVEPRTLAVVAAVLGAVGLLATWVPARRAARVDPMNALRHE